MEYYIFDENVENILKYSYSRKTQTATQASRYLEIWGAYNTLQVEFKEKTKAALAKNIKITSSHLTTDEIEDKIDKGDISVFSSAIIQVKNDYYFNIY